jgi:hypothetical protein
LDLIGKLVYYDFFPQPAYEGLVTSPLRSLTRLFGVIAPISAVSLWDALVGSREEFAMKRLSRLVCVSLLLLGTSVAQERVLKILDQLPSAGPVENTGTVQFSETALGAGRIEVSHSDDWTVKNISPKPIIALVATLRIGDDNATRVERQAQYEAFFHPTLVEPGQTISFSQDFLDRQIIESEELMSGSLSCDAMVRWIQFADGTTFGDANYAKQLLVNRKAILEALKHLRDVYASNGSEKFVEELQRRISPPVVDGYLEHIRTVLQKEGTQSAIQTLEMHLEYAEQRAKLLSPPLESQ